MVEVSSFQRAQSTRLLTVLPGLQCHTAPFSWKLVFEYDHQLFEITLSACSPKEELEWRSRLADRSCNVTPDAVEQAVFAMLSLRIKPMGTVFGKPGESRDVYHISATTDALQVL